MAETKQGGFHAFEQRVHQIEEEDQKAARKGSPSEGGGAPRESKPAEKPAAKKAEKGR